MEAVRQDVQQEAADEFLRIEHHDAVTGLAFLPVSRAASCRRSCVGEGGELVTRLSWEAPVSGATRPIQAPPSDRR